MKDSPLEIPYHPEQMADCGTVSLSYDSFGDPQHPPIMLIMGLATQLIHWDEEFCRLLAARGFWVIRFDNRDIGNSSKLDAEGVPNLLGMFARQMFGRTLKAPYLLDDMAQDTLTLMDVLSVPHAHVVGVSMGGMIAQCMALLAPERVLSMTSIMSTTGNRSLPKPKKSVSMLLARPQPKEEEAFVQQTLSLWQVLHGDTYDFDAERVGNMIRRARQRSFHPKGVIRQLAAILASEDRTRRLRDLSVPTLVMHGDDDPLVPLACGLATKDAVPNARLRVFKGMGHTLPKEVWSAMIDEIVQLTEHSKTVITGRG